MKYFAEKAVLVTAAASGIGEATAEAFARQGARLLLSDVDFQRGERVVERLREAGTEAYFCQADGTREDDVVRLITTTIEKLGALHVAVNVVGGAAHNASGPDLHLQSVGAWDVTLGLSLRSTFLALKHEIGHMLDHDGGAIVNVASLAGMRYVPEGGGAYSAAKAAVIHLTRFAALSYAERAIRVNCIAPGVTMTNGLVSAVGADAAKTMADRMANEHAIKRPIEAREQADAILWLASDAAAMVTGQVVAVDGGWSAR